MSGWPESPEEIRERVANDPNKTMPETLHYCIAAAVAYEIMYPKYMELQERIDELEAKYYALLNERRPQ